jgi:hypothetical protein
MTSTGDEDAARGASFVGGLRRGCMDIKAIAVCVLPEVWDFGGRQLGFLKQHDVIVLGVLPKGIIHIAGPCHILAENADGRGGTNRSFPWEPKGAVPLGPVWPAAPPPMLSL